MRVLVTGAAGFIGSTIVDQLRERGDEVVPVDVLLPAAHAGRPDWVSELHEVDVRDEQALAPLLTGVDLVCHQAAMVGLGLDAHDAPAFVSQNVLGTATLLSAMTRAGVSGVVQASSMVVYGDGGYTCAEHGEVRPAPRRPEDLDAGRFDPPCPHCGRAVDWHPIDEDAGLDPRTTYAATKLAQEHLAAAWCLQTGGRAVSLRYHNVYGARMPRDTPYAGVASMFRSSLAAGRPPRVFEDGAQQRDFVEVTDVARANLAALDALTDADGPAPGGPHRAYNVASGRPRSILDLAVRMAEVMDGPRPEVVGGGRPGDVRHIVADPGRARTELGFSARVGFDDGVAAFVAAPMRAPAAGGRTTA
ncbi:dTDP-L-rhamnose 4-epimerase [Friedmanniella endophytica]|uniref:dTDP-L-rhamnose 4-epimerase n=1 Tax=Microlunatus kandeliicorticis TaxID=1759536 RepID=A0A7W3IRR2_9ACTN|nr:NAD-dependent epimerase/dehydratase family protein [Microlunatus kandeliicorticis]MBA8793960.1 dTDP-L-rhamnose 4-epimerase [Microlunatus kandeliicorticis]